MNSKYNISILLPTRGRTASLMKSVQSLFDHASNKKTLELRLGYDKDDSVGLDHFKTVLQPWLKQHEVIYTAMLFEPMGYGNLNAYVNSLAKDADCDWYFFWNDDAVMNTKDWDSVIGSYTGQFKLLAVHTHNDHPYSIFPIVPRAWHDTLGHLSQHQMNDAWLSQIAYKLDVMERIPVWVTHDRKDLTGNNGDDTYNQRIMYEGNPSNPRDFHNQAVIIKRIEETEKLARHMVSQGLDTSFWERIKLGKQDPWVKLKQNDVNGQMKQFSVTKDGAMVQTNEPETKSQKLYDYEYFNEADGIVSWQSRNLKFGDAMAGLSYAHGIKWQQLVDSFPIVFEFNEHGRGEPSNVSMFRDQLAFLKDNKKRTPKRVLEIGGGRGEVANTLKYLGADVVSVELGEQAVEWYKRTGEHFFGALLDPVIPVVKPIQDAVQDLDLSSFDTILMVESLEHIPAEAFEPVWQAICQQFKGLFIVTNWPDYHPIWIGRDASPEEHCRVVDDELYDQWSKQAKKCVYRQGSHLVLKF